MGTSVDYDLVAPSYDRRYVERDYSGIGRTLRGFAPAGGDVLEVGCGTGHWLELLRQWRCEVIGLDPSAEMLRGAQGRDDRAPLARGRAERLPFRARSFDLVVVINALHHFEDKPRFVAEAMRVLRPGGRIVTMGLDPGSGVDEWYIYHYFGGTLEVDRARYPRCDTIAAWLRQSGFSAVSTAVAHHMSESEEARSYLERGALSRHATSQLSLLSDDEYRTGVEGIRRDIALAESEGRIHKLWAELRIYATSGLVPSG